MNQFTEEKEDTDQVVMFSATDMRTKLQIKIPQATISNSTSKNLRLQRCHIYLNFDQLKTDMSAAQIYMTCSEAAETGRYHSKCYGSNIIGILQRDFPNFCYNLIYSPQFSIQSNIQFINIYFWLIPYATQITTDYALQAFDAVDPKLQAMLILNIDNEIN